MFLIVHNPLSNKRRSKITTKRMVRFFKRNSIPFALRSTLKIENLSVYLENNPKITDILYLGGDGSINYLINNVDISKIKQNIYLAKSGSGNDFLRSLNRIHKGNITIGEAKTNAGNTKFINGIGIGIDSLICHYVDSDVNKSKLSYFLHFFRSIIKYRRRDFEIIVDGEKHHFTKGYSVIVQNGKFFGGGMMGAPFANITNDDFEVYVIHNLNNFGVQLLFMTVYLGWHRFFKKRVAYFRGKEIQINVKDPYYFQTDGEVVEGVNEIVIKKLMTKEFTAFKKKDFKSNIVKKIHS
ncbi:MAG: hypothetical protein KAH13_00085 [Tenericutes bacterium]|nr:hypothetical protein [Mycoplasmatota bacterium]